jgi:hypothetical protein
MWRCKNCLAPMKNNDQFCVGCGEQAAPRPGRARLMSVVVDSVLKEFNLAGRTVPDEDARIVVVEISIALRQSPAYERWVRQLSTLQPSEAIFSALHFGWALREAVESNWWDSLPRASDPVYTETLKQLANELLGR